MGAVMESFLLGLKDARVGKYFQAPSSSDALVASYAYKGIRNGAYLNAKIDRVSYSKVSNDFQTVQTRRSITAAEVSFP